MISTRFLQFLKQLIPIIETNRINGKTDTAKSIKAGRKHTQTVTELSKGKFRQASETDLKKRKAALLWAAMFQKNFL